MISLGATPSKLPQRVAIAGQRVTLLPLHAIEHSTPLFEQMHGHPELWRYMFDPPPASEEDFREDLAAKAAKTDQIFYTIIRNVDTMPLGIASLLRIEPMHRVIEVGNILYSPRLQRTPEATETMYLMAKYVFEDLGYRRYEWKCNALNEPSRKAALRLGFTFEGIFRQHMIIKGENRDTAWFSMLDGEWPVARSAFEQWLDEGNFDGQRQQIKTLVSFR